MCTKIMLYTVKCIKENFIKVNILMSKLILTLFNSNEMKYNKIKVINICISS